MISSARFVVHALLVLSFAAAQEGPPKSFAVTNDDAKRLVNLALKEQGAAKLPGLWVEPLKNARDDGFYFLDATWNNPGPAGVSVGHFAVDRKTGDMWDAVVCRRINSPKVKEFQSKLRRRMGMTKEIYEKVKRSGPMC